MGGSSGGGGTTPINSNTVTTQAPTLASNTTNSTTHNRIPSWLEGTSKNLVSRANKLSKTPYESYGGQRVADFTDLTNRAFDRIGGQQVAGQIGTATDLATQAGQQSGAAGQYDPFAMGGFDSATAQQYMNPYVSNVLDAQTREAQRAADIATQSRQAAAVKSGAYGGGRQAIMDSEAARNLALQQGDIRATGLAQAYDTGRSQYLTEAQLREQSRQFGADLGLRGDSQALQAAQILGGLGETQFGQEMAITQGLGTAGQMQQQQQQNILDVGYQDWQAEQQYPYEQMSWLQGIISGVPHSTTQQTSSHTSGITTPGAQTSVQTQSGGDAAPPNGWSQGAGAAIAGAGAVLEAYDGGTGAASGGVVGYADGGITGLMSDPQLEQRMQNPEIPTIARLAAELRLQENAQMRQQAQMNQSSRVGRPTVAQETAAGLAGLPVGDFGSFARGGIMTFAEGGSTDEDEYEGMYAQAYRQGDEKGSIYDPEFGRGAEPAWRDSAPEQRVIELPEGTTQQEAEQVRMNNPDAKVRVEGSGSVWKKVGSGIKDALTYSSDIEAERARANPQPKAAPQEQGIRALTMPADAQVSAQEGAKPAGWAAVPQQVGAPRTAAPVPAAPRAAPVVSAPPAGIMAAPEAQAVAAPTAPAAPGGVGGIEAEMRAARAEAAMQQAELLKIRQAEADARQAEADDERKLFAAERAKAGEVDKEKRERIEGREKDLSKQKKSAFNYALIRAGLAMMQGTSPYAMVNIGRGLSAGVEGYTADLAAIDKARETLRSQLDELADIRAQQATATGKQKRELDRAFKEAERNAKYGTKALALESGVKTSQAQTDVMFKAFLDHRLRGEEKTIEHGRDLEKAKLTGDLQLRNTLARPRSASTRGEVTAKDLATARINAAKAWDTADPVSKMGLQKQYGSRDAYIRSVEALMSGGAADSGPSPDLGGGGWKVTPE